MRSAVFEPAILGMEQSLTYDLDRTATGIGLRLIYCIKINHSIDKPVTARIKIKSLLFP